MQQQTTCCGLKHCPKFSKPAHILPLERLLRSGFNPSHLNALVDPLQSLSILKYFPHMTTSDWMEWTSWRWLKRQVAHRAIADVSWHETTWSRARDAIYSQSNLRCWEYAFWRHISTNLREMSWKNSTKLCDNVHTAGEYSDIQVYAISMSNIGYATLYSKLPTWHGVRCVPWYISCCSVYISEFYEPILAWGIQKGL